MVKDNPFAGNGNAIFIAYMTLTDQLP